jgi:hypothetical protein
MTCGGGGAGGVFSLQATGRKRKVRQMIQAEIALIL